MNHPQTPGLLRRLAAIIYDTLIVGAILIAATAVIMPFTRGNAVDAGTLWFQLYIGGIVLLYFAGFWLRGGQTIGMVAWRLQVVKHDGQSISAGQAIIRALTAALSWLVAGLGFWWVLLDRKKRAWHDLASRSELVLLESANARAPAPPQ